MDLPDEHRRCLAWFEGNEGKIVPWPALEIDGMRLVTRARGIYKPKGWKYALSVRKYLMSQYGDGDVESLPGGGWTLLYHQQGNEGEDGEWANKSILECVADGIPLGVLRQVTPKSQGTTFEVLGLALPVSLEGGFFRLVSQDALSVVAQEATARSQVDAQGAVDMPGSDYDGRLRALRQIVARQGQADFRNALIDAYHGRCAVTGCDAVAVLEAAHLRPYRGPNSNIVSNGLLLRADVHTLLDYQLLAIDPGTGTVCLSAKLAGTQYKAIDGTPLANPKAEWQRPNRDILDVMWHDFQKAEAELKPSRPSRHTLPGPALAYRRAALSSDQNA